jgi:hypothetical protein
MKKTTIFGMLFIAAISLLFSSLFVSAYRGNYDIEGPECSEERRELISEAFATLDYSKWSNLMQREGKTPKVLTVITESNFDRFVEAYNLGKSGNSVAASELRSELGLNNGVGQKEGKGYQNGIIQENKEIRLDRTQFNERISKNIKQQGRV